MNQCWVDSRLGFHGSSAGKESACSAGDPSSIPGLWRSPGDGIDHPLQYSWASLVAKMAKNPPAMPETWVWSLGCEDPLEEGISSILTWRIPMDRAAWRATVPGVTKSQAQLSDQAQHNTDSRLEVFSYQVRRTYMGIWSTCTILLLSKVLQLCVCCRRPETFHFPLPSFSDASILSFVLVEPVLSWACSLPWCKANGEGLSFWHVRYNILGITLLTALLPVVTLFFVVVVNSKVGYFLGHPKQELYLIIVSGNDASFALVCSRVWSHLLSVFLELLFLVCWWHFFSFQHHLFIVFLSQHIFSLISLGWSLRKENSNMISWPGNLNGGPSCFS